MAADTNSRETRRRRRILQQGSDRLDFITGRIHSLPPTPSPYHPGADADADAASSSQPDPLISNHPNITPVLPHVEAEEEEESHSILPTHDPVTDPNHSDSHQATTQTPPLYINEAENEISSVPTSEFEHLQPHLDSSLDDSGTQQHSQQPQNEKSKLFIIPSEISSAINALRVTRLCCSVAVALLVVASYLGFSLLGTRLIQSVISFRPLYLVLVTNLTVVIARILYGKQRGLDERSERRENERSTDDGDQRGTQLARTLELGLVMQNLVDAVFMDCAVYAIIVICGLSLVQA